MKVNVKKFFLSLTLFVIFVLLIPEHINYLHRFDEGYANVLKWYGSPVIEWIKNNSSLNDVFLAADPRRLAWLTNRTFVDMHTNASKLSVSELNSLIQSFNVSYVIIDAFLITYTPHSNFFEYLYSGPLKLGQIYPIVKEDVINNILDELTSTGGLNCTIDTYGLKLVFEYHPESSRTVRIYRVTKATFLIKIEFQDSFVKNWRAGNNGKLLITENNGFKLIIGKGTNYTYTYHETPLNISLKGDAMKFLAWKITEINDVNIERIEIWKSKEKFLASIIPPSTPSTWFTYVGNDITSINDLRIVIKGKSGGYINLKYLVIGTIQVNE
jgi:hypothetical protein